MNVGLLVTLLVGGLGLGGTLGYFFGMDQGKKEALSTMQVTSANQDDAKLFLIDGQVFTGKDIPSELQTRLYGVEKELFDQKEGLLKEYALRLSLAKSKNATVDPNNLPPLEELMDKPKISEEEMKAFFEANKDRLPPNTAYDQIKDRLQQFMVNQKSVEVFQTTWNQLATEGKVKLLVAAPVAPVVAIPTEKFPQKGAKDAPNVLVEVSDYLCPHCQEVHPQVKAAIEELGGKVRLVQMNFSLRPQDLSGSLAEGAYCAMQQGDEAYWKYNDAAFSGTWGNMGDKASLEKPKEIAQKAGIDATKMEECLKSEAPKKFVNETREIANSIGITGTPTFFLNNRKVNLPHGGDLAKVLKESLTAQTGS